MKRLLVVVLVLSLLVVSSCSGGQNAFSCDVDGDCGATFDRCTCSWVCKNKDAQLSRSDDFECDDQCPPASVFPPRCGCVAVPVAGDEDSSRVLTECRLA